MPTNDSGLETPQTAKGIGGTYWLEETGLSRQLPNSIGRLSAISRIGKHIVDRQNTPRPDARRPGAIIGQCCVKAVPAVNKDHAQIAPPMRCQGAATTDDGNHRFANPRGFDVASELIEGVELSRSVDQIVVVVAFSRLMFFRASVMVDGKDHRTPRSCRLPQPNSGSPAITPDLQQGSEQGRFQPPVEQLSALVIREKSAH